MTTAPEHAARERRARQRRAQTSSRRAHDQLRTSIRLGLMADMVLMEHAMVQALCTSRNAVREALQLLADERLVERSPRTGTKLSGAIHQVPLNEVLPRPGAHPAQSITARVLEWQAVPATPTLAHRLEVEVDATLHMSEQLILVDAEPIAVQCVYSVEAMREQPVGAADANEYVPDDLSTTLHRIFGPQTIGGPVENHLQAVACEPRTAARLHLPVGAPLLSRELLFRNLLGEPYLFGYAHYRGDRVSIDAVAHLSHTRMPLST